MNIAQFFNKKTPGQSIKLKINGMHCTSCALNIDGALEETEGVFSSQTSYAKGEVTIQYDPKKITPAELAEVVTNQGYLVEQ
jgi:copper chaperone CopZ